MQPRAWPEVPAGTASVARRAFRKGSLAMRARDELGAWCQDEVFSAAYRVRGAPGISPAQLAMVTVLQFTENLTDRQAADAVRGRLDWKYCLDYPPPAAPASHRRMNPNKPTGSERRWLDGRYAGSPLRVKPDSRLMARASAPTVTMAPMMIAVAGPMPAIRELSCAIALAMPSE
jgi:Transposase domain (DUF772)